jgi:hypothetical protein
VAAGHGAGAILSAAFIQPGPVPPILLRLLLCLCLVVNTTGGAWAASGMTMPAPVQASSAPCHDAAMAGMVGMADEHAPVTPHHAAGQKHDSCCKSGSCDCLQHCSVTLALPASIPLPAIRASQPGWALHDRHGDPAPYRPIRPPIA